MKLFNLTPVVIILCCFCLHGKAQEYSYRHYDIKDGLIGNNVYHTVQDKEGFLWFATETGVSRFDGTTFKNFTTAEGLPDNEILKLFVDSKGRVWMIPFNSKICYYYKGKIFNAENDPVLRSLKIKAYLQKIFEDTKGNIYFLEPMNLIVLNNRNEVLQKDSIDHESILTFGGGIQNNGIPAAFISAPNKETYFYKIEINSKEITLVKENDAIKFWGNKMTSTNITKQLIIYNNNHNEKTNLQSSVFYHPSGQNRDTIDFPKGFNLFSLINDSLLFFNTESGALEYDFNKKKYLDKYLENENVSAVVKDFESNLWFSTLGKGVYRLHSNGNKNISFINKAGTNKPIVSIIGINECILAGADNVIYKKNKTEHVFLPSYTNAKPGLGKVIKMMTRNGFLYLLTEFYIYKLNITLKEIIPLYNTIFQSTYKDMDFNKKGDIFLATHEMGLSFNEKGKQFIKFINERCTAISSTDSGVFVGTLTGLKFVDLKQQVYTFGDKFPLLKNRITKLLASGNKLWIGTNDNGIICFDGRKIVKVISEKEGLSGNLVRALYIDHHNLWVGTDRGLNKINLVDTAYPVIQKYTTSDGLSSNMINAVYANRDTVYVGTPEGLSYFHEQQMKINSRCELRILGITVSGKDISPDTAKLFLKHADNNIRFDFVAISYKSEGDILYYYKLSGIDTAWKMTKENFLQYPTLPSGDYKLQLYAINKFGVKSKSMDIDFQVEKKWYEETVNIFLVILSALLLGWAITNWRIRKLKQSQNEKNANAEKIARLEQQALKAQMNPHFIFNCLNSIQQYVIDKDVQGANKFISGFSKLIRQTLDNSGRQNISVAEEENFLRSYLELEKSRFEDKFDYVIYIDPAIDKDHDYLPPMLLQPYIENCIRHGIMHKNNGKGIIDIQFNLKNRNLICSISDNGVGRKAANAFKSMQHFNYQSKGTSITGQRINMMNINSPSAIILNIEDLIDSNNEPCGTTVTIVIPLQNVD